MILVTSAGEFIGVIMATFKATFWLTEGQDMTNSSFLSDFSIFSEIEPSALEVLAAKFRRRSFKKGEVIFHQEDPGDRLYVVESGLVRISVTVQDGRGAAVVGSQEQ